MVARNRVAGSPSVEYFRVCQDGEVRSMLLNTSSAAVGLWKEGKMTTDALMLTREQELFLESGIHPEMRFTQQGAYHG